jgi:hypothetical protein
VNVRLHIDRLVVDGFDLGPGGSDSLHEAVESELMRLVTADGLDGCQMGQAMPSLRLPAIQADQNPSALGRQVARSLYQGLRGLGGQ